MIIFLLLLGVLLGVLIIWMFRHTLVNRLKRQIKAQMLKKYPTVGIVAMFKNEGQVLFEWILHHVEEGVTEFILLNNDSTDDFVSQVNKVREVVKGSGVVIQVIDTPGRHVQNRKLFQYWNKVKTDWVMIIDLDEFVYARRGFKTIPQYLASVDADVEQIWLTWKMFSTGGHRRMPESIVSGSTRRWEDAECWGSGKTIYRVKGNHRGFLNYHRGHRPAEGNKLILSNNIESTDFGPRKPVCRTKEEIEAHNLHLNHYSLISFEFYKKVKMTRGDAADKNSNDVRDLPTYFNKRDKLFDKQDDDELLRKRGGPGWVSRIPKDRPWPVGSHQLPRESDSWGDLNS